MTGRCAAREGFRRGVVAAVAVLALGAVAGAEPFLGFDNPDLPPVPEAPGEWGLKIVVFNVGQADALLLLTPNGNACLIDSGKSKEDGNKIADYLASKARNGVGEIRTLDLVYTTSFAPDHLRGLPRLVQRGVRIRKALDLGRAGPREGRPEVRAYAGAVGDPNGDLVQGNDEPDFVRHRIHPGHAEHLGLEDAVEIRCLGARGKAPGGAHDLDLDPVGKAADFDERPGSVALLVRFAEFEFVTTGDASAEVEKRLLASGAFGEESDIDVLKVGAHGSDAATAREWVGALLPEVAIVSSAWAPGAAAPRKNPLRRLQAARSMSLITGDGVSPETGDYAESDAPEPGRLSERAVFNSQGTVTILVSADGNRYTVTGDSFSRTFSAIDGENARQPAPADGGGAPPEKPQ
jgi:beta-lactamase superfamily II metal-dependent hydrolase